jgi:hypothetical protein
VNDYSALLRRLYSEIARLHGARDPDAVVAQALAEYGKAYVDEATTESRLARIRDLSADHHHA